MEIDKCFANEIRKLANGDGSREFRILFKDELARVSKELASRYAFDGCIEKRGRVKVALCVAATVTRFAYRYENRVIEWARLVLAEWTNKTPISIETAEINLHPAILADNSASLRRLTTVE